jgi:hypothetical protein
MWGVGMFWLVIGCATVVHQLIAGGIPFDIGAWGE